ncbi:MAG: NADH-ubiquinone oxidoreductase-F iron-sulfur binding region domain-containing protein, partial [Anaerolineales bacterium]
DLMLKIAEAMTEVSNCGLGQTASISISDFMKYFRPEIETHIVDHCCPLGVCPVSAAVPEAAPAL